MELAAKLDDYGKLAWIGVMVLGFVLFWPVGLAILAYLIWSGRMACWNRGGMGRRHRNGARRDRDTAGWCGAWPRAQSSSGNQAFDEYREETLRRLEDEQEDFQTFLERLRHAKDKAEFDQFMEDRRRQPDKPEARQAPEGWTPQPEG